MGKVKPVLYLAEGMKLMWIMMVLPGLPLLMLSPWSPGKGVFAQEPLVVLEGTVDEKSLFSEDDTEYLKKARLDTKRIRIQFPEIGGEAKGEFELRISGFALGEFNYDICEFFHGDCSSADEAYRACTIDWWISGNLEGSFDPKTYKLSGTTVMVGRAVENKGTGCEVAAAVVRVPPSGYQGKTSTTWTALVDRDLKGAKGSFDPTVKADTGDFGLIKPLPLQSSWVDPAEAEQML